MAATETLIDRLLAEQRDLTAVERFARVHEAGPVPALEKKYRSLIPLTRPQFGEQYAFHVDLDKCSGCKSCVTACHSLNGLDEGEMWRNVGLIIGQQKPKGAPAGSLETLAYQQTITTACHHCIEPGCADGCPVLAYEKDAVTGIVRHLDDQCIGCQYCVLKCPYGVPKYSERKGIVRKCDMCQHRLAAGEAPACVQACPNEAIKIEIVNQEAVRAQTSPDNARLVAGAFPSNYTRPTTRFTSALPIPASAQPADIDHLALEHAHWPLVLMLILTQLAAGLHVAQAAWLLIGGIPSARSFAIAGLLALLAGLNVATLHLGRPLKAWRAFLGWRKSWMSREILAFSAYFAPAALLVLRPYDSALAIITAVLGLLGVACSAMIYVDTQRPAWRAAIVFPRFIGTAALLGLFGSTVISAAFSSTQTTSLALGAALLSAFLLVCEVCQRRHALQDKSSSLHRSVRIERQLLNRVRQAQIGLSGAAIGLLILVAASRFSLAGSLAAFLAMLVSQVLDRYSFFTTCPAPRMPGGVTA